MKVALRCPFLMPTERAERNRKRSSHDGFVTKIKPLYHARFLSRTRERKKREKKKRKRGGEILSKRAFIKKQRPLHPARFLCRPQEGSEHVAIISPRLHKTKCPSPLPVSYAKYENENENEGMRLSHLTFAETFLYRKKN